MWRLGLDVGTNSIGWAALELTGTTSPRAPQKILDAGARIFTDGRNPKDGQSLAVMRRLPRQQRRQRDRRLKRRNEFMNKLVSFGLMPGDPVARKLLQKRDPWQLRVEGLEKKLDLYDLGRALFHLQQRRGFLSNRKTDAGPDDESGKIKSAAKRVRDAMQAKGARTLGEYLARVRVEDSSAQHENPVRARLVGQGAKAFYEFYPTRDLILEEFDVLWAAQQSHHESGLTSEAFESLRDTLAFQRKLKPQPVGKCSIDPSQQRAPRSLPTVQRFRIFQEINNLRCRAPGTTESELTLEQRDLLVNKALTTKKLTFDAIQKALKLPVNTRFNLESSQRKHLDGDLTAAVLAHKDRWGKAWRELPLSEQESVIERLLVEEDESALIAWLTKNHGLTETQAVKVSNAPLPEGHGNLCREVTTKVLSALESDVITYDKAVNAAGYISHSDVDSDGEKFDRKLPYYGAVLERHVAFGSGDTDDLDEKRFGKIANPTVHVALNQIRQVVNALIKRFGPPTEIVVEVARDLPLSGKARRELERSQKDNREANDKRRRSLVELGQRDSYDNRLRMRLWEEINPDDPLARCCPYTGVQIGINRLFDSEVEIEHILPLSRTLDDSPANKTLSLRHANRFKGQRTPYEAFSDSPETYNWDDIAARGSELPGNKAWRFAPDAMARYTNEEQDFLGRQLNDTRYISRLAKTYLLRTGADVWVSPGRLTSDLRWAWGLDSILAGHNEDEAVQATKNRDDHRHHTIDAIVISLTDRGLLQNIATAAGRAEERLDKSYLANINAPWLDFRDHVRAVIDQVVISHKPNHGVQGALHNDTAYGVVAPPDKKGRSRVVHRVPLSTLTTPKKLENIRDQYTREFLLRKTEGLTDKAFMEALLKAGREMRPPLRKVRICETLSVIPIADSAGKVYKAYKGDANYCYDIYLDKRGRWTGEVISRFNANQPSFDPNSKTAKNGQALLMRLRVNDLVAIAEKGQRRIMRIVMLSEGIITVAEHFEGGSLRNRDRDKENSFKFKSFAPSALQISSGRLVHVDPAGHVFDPGPI